MIDSIARLRAGGQTARVRSSGRGASLAMGLAWRGALAGAAGWLLALVALTGLAAMPAALAAEQEGNSSAPGEKTDPPPPGVVRVFGSERMRTWWYPNSLAVSPDGKTVAVEERDRGIRLFNLASGQTIKVISTDSGDMDALAFDANARQLAVGTEGGTIEIWDLVGGSRTQRFESGRAAVLGLAFANDGAGLLTCGMDRKIKLWDTTSAKLLQETECDLATQDAEPDEIAVAFSPDGKYFVSGCPDGVLRIWNVSTATPGSTLQAHQRQVNGVTVKSRILSVAISADGKLLASCGWDGTAKIWAFPSGELLQTVRPRQRGRMHTPTSVALSPDGRFLAVGLLWAPGGGDIELREARTGELQSDLLGHVLGVTDLAFTPDGRLLVSAAYDRAIKVWDVQQSRGEVHPPPAHKESVHSVAFSPDGKLLATVGIETDGVVRLWVRWPCAGLR